MRKKELRAVIAFSATTDAMAAEAHLKGAGIPGRLIPVPREIRAGCGLAWSSPAESGEAARQALGQAGIPWESWKELLL
ncbi:MAG TPA: DUF3343 domain-containing protein [Candidatus Ventrimonas merdavium]|nr:DUF3343 domain-containing protein [Candidatus Ventrimonas merdavium]